MSPEELHQISLTQALQNLVNINKAASAPNPTTIRDPEGVYQTGQESELRQASIPVSSYDPYKMNEPQVQNPNDIQLETQNLDQQNKAVDAANKLDLYKRLGLSK